MAQSVEERIAELESQVSVESRISELEGQPKPKSSGGFMEMLVRNISQPFNQGLLNLPALLPGGDSLTADMQRLGMVAPEGERAEGFIPRSMEIMGGSVLPGGAVAGAGRQIIGKSLPAVLPQAVKHAPVATTMPQSVLPNIAAQTASRPGATAGAEVLAAFGGGAGGEIAEEIGVNPTVGELTGGGLAAVAPAVARPTMQLLQKIGGIFADTAQKTPIMGPVVRMGRDVIEGAKGATNPYHRAAKEAQSRVVDPVDAASKIDVQSPMPPARQIGESRMLGLEENLRGKSSPQQAEMVERHIEQAKATAKREAIDLDGDTALPRQVIEEKGAATVARQTEKANTAIKEADDAIKAIDPEAEPWDISATAYKKVEEAQKAARAAERADWEDVGFESPGDYDSTVDAVNNIMGATGRATRGEAVPAAVKEELRKAGFHTENGRWVKKPLEEGEQAAETTLRDIHAMRQVVQGLKGAAVLDPEKRAMVKWLNDLESALLNDMEAVSTANPDALKIARATTKDFYDKFRRGKMGEILGYSERGRKAVMDVDALNKVMSGATPARDLEQMLAAAPGSKPDAVAFLRKQFLMAAVNRKGVFNKNAAEAYIAKLKKQRMFEVLPGLEDDLVRAASTSERSALLQERAAIVKKRGGARIERDSNESVASTYTKKPIGEEATILLDKKTANPVKLARKLHATMGGNEQAEEGLRQAFREALWRGGKGGTDLEGYDIASARNFSRLVREHIGTMKALKFSDENIQNIKRLATLMRQSEIAPKKGDVTDRTMTDIPGIVLNRISQLLGARTGSWINKALGGSGAGAGVSLQAAQMGSGTARQISSALRVDPAEQLLLAAMDDSALMKALLLRNNATEAAKKQAASRLNAWAVGAGLTDDEESVEP